MFRSKECVYAVYQEKSFSRAAEKLYISQPGLSAAIKKVEMRLGCPIFDRSTTPISLTPAGEYYIRYVESIMEMEEDIVARFSGGPQDDQYTLHVGSASFFCAHILPGLIAPFKEKYPNCRVEIREENASNLKESLRDEALDFAISVDAMETEFYENRVLTHETILLAVPSCWEINHTLEKYRLTFQEVKNGEYFNPIHPSVSVGHFSKQPFLFLKQGNDGYKRGLEICRQAGFEPNISLFVDQLLTSYYIACSGAGMMFVRADLTSYVEPTEALYFYKINNALASRNVYLHFKKQRKYKPVALQFIKHIEEIS